MKAAEASKGSHIWQNLQKHGLDDNPQTLGWRIQREIEDGIENTPLMGAGIREASKTLRALVPMANFTTGTKAAIAQEYLAYVKTNVLQSPKLNSNSGIEAFSHMPAALLHDPDQIADIAWETRAAAVAATAAAGISEGNSSPPHSEKELRRRKCKSHYGGAAKQF